MRSTTMTYRYETRTTPLNSNGAHRYDWHISSGGDTPAAARKQGIFSENPYTCKVGSFLNGPVHMDLNGGYDASVQYATGGGFKGWVNPEVPSNIKALSNLLEKFKQSDFNLAVSVGESRESWHMISDRMFKFAEALKRTRRGDLPGALRAMGSSKRVSRKSQRKLDSGDVSGSFLELQYGWVPLLNDIYNAAEVINTPNVSKPSVRTSVVVTGPDRLTAMPGHQADATTRENKRSVYHIAKLSTTELSMAVRLGLAQPMSIAWELTTLSFVADWFLPVGDLIQAVEATYLLPVGKYIKSDVLRQSCSLVLSANTRLWGPWNVSHGGGVMTYKSTEMTRTVLSKAPENIFDGSGPRQSLIDLDLSLSQLSSASALLHQAFKAFRR